MTTLASPHPRRAFLARTALATAACAVASPWPAFAAEPAPGRRMMVAFSKPFTDLDFEATADLVAEVGWDGIECPVRAKSTHIAPEKIEDDLPRMVEALRKRGKQIALLTTDITRVTPAAEKILRTMARLGITRYRLGSEKYPRNEHPSKKLAELGAALKDVAALNRELGVQGGWQNHSGADTVGAPVWDIWSVVRDLDPKHLGMCFDIGHATLEGGLSWPIQARLMEPHFVAVYFKDFTWEQTPKGWQPRWCLLGDGAVSRTFAAQLKSSAFSGPISQHHEYKELGTGRQMVANFKKDLEVLRAWLA